MTLNTSPTPHAWADIDELAAGIEAVFEAFRTLGPNHKIVYAATHHHPLGLSYTTIERYYDVFNFTYDSPTCYHGGGHEYTLEAAIARADETRIHDTLMALKWELD